LPVEGECDRTMPQYSVSDGRVQRPRRESSTRDGQHRRRDSTSRRTRSSQPPEETPPAGGVSISNTRDSRRRSRSRPDVRPTIRAVRSDRPQKRSRDHDPEARAFLGGDAEAGLRGGGGRSGGRGGASRDRGEKRRRKQLAAVAPGATVAYHQPHYQFDHAHPGGIDGTNASTDASGSKRSRPVSADSEDTIEEIKGEKRRCGRCFCKSEHNFALFLINYSYWFFFSFNRDSGDHQCNLVSHNHSCRSRGFQEE
jgi:hypothetical protein